MTYKSSFSAVFFDLDGTLIDTAVEFILVVQSIRAEQHLQPLKDSKIRERISDGASELVKLALEIEESDPDFDSHRGHFLALYSKIAGSKCAPFAGILNLIEWLGERKIKWGIATNKPRLYTNAIIEKINFKPMPGVVVCPEDISHPKPSPEALLYGCEKLRCEPNEAVYIGDNARDIAAGQNAGMYTIAAGYGYISAQDKPHTWGADALALNAQDLKRLLVSAVPYFQETKLENRKFF